MKLWKEIPNHKNYQVSSCGYVRSFWSGEWKILKLKISHQGYSQIRILKNGKQKDYMVHQLVAMAFLNHNPIGHKLVIDHKNGIKNDNRIENLQLVTQRFNVSKDKIGFSSNYTGVSWKKENKKWLAQAYVNGKKRYLGLFENQEIAHEAYTLAIGGN